MTQKTLHANKEYWPPLSSKVEGEPVKKEKVMKRRNKKKEKKRGSN